MLSLNDNHQWFSRDFAFGCLLSHCLHGKRMTSIIIWGPGPCWTALRFAISHKLGFQGMIMLSSPLAAGEEWYLIIRQMHSVLAGRLPSPTDIFLSPNHLHRPMCKWCRKGISKISPWSRGRMRCSWILDTASMFCISQLNITRYCRRSILFRSQKISQQLFTEMSRIVFYIFTYLYLYLIHIKSSIHIYYILFKTMCNIFTKIIYINIYSYIYVYFIYLKPSARGTDLTQIGILWLQCGYERYLRHCFMVAWHLLWPCRRETTSVLLSGNFMYLNKLVGMVTWCGLLAHGSGPELDLHLSHGSWHDRKRQS